MSSTFLLQRRREMRLRRFGIALGLVLALLFHLVLFWGPRVGYQPLLEQARVRRVLVARPYQPAPPPKPKPKPTKSAKRKPPPPPQPTTKPKPQPTPTKRAKAGAAAAKPTPQPPAPVAAKTHAAIAEQAAGGGSTSNAAAARGPVSDASQVRPLDGDASSKTSPSDKDDWSDLLASLSQREQDIKKEWKARRDEIAAQASSVSADQTTWGGGGRDEDGEGYLDSRIRMTVVSYPQTTIDSDYLQIAYPDLRFRRAQLQKGICRVYYRVWTDGTGEIVRTQLKTPATKTEQEYYAEFVDQVVTSVAEWPFPRQESEVHIDVLFEIE